MRLKNLLDREPLAIGDAVKVGVGYGVLEVAGSLPEPVQFALFSVAVAVVTKIQREVVWSPAGVREFVARYLDTEDNTDDGDKDTS